MESIEVKFEVNHNLGLHLRPIALLIQIANNFDEKIELSNDSRNLDYVDAKKLLDILNLRISQGNKISIKATGENPKLAIESLKDFLKHLDMYITQDEANEEEEKIVDDLPILSIITKKWAISILRNLTYSEHLRFSEINKKLPNISPSVLTTRLKELEQNALIVRTQYTEIPPRVVYSLTEKGLELTKNLKRISQWSQKWLYLESKDNDSNSENSEYTMKLKHLKTSEVLR